MNYNIEIPYESFLSEHPDHQVFDDLRQFIFKVYMTQNAVNACICNTKKALKKKMAGLIAEQKMAA